MESFFSRYKNPLVLAIVLVAQFFLLAVQVRRPFPAATAKVDQESVRALRFGVATVVTPPESVLHKGGLSLRGIWSSYLDLVGVRAENEQLKEEIDQLHLEQAALAEDARQGERLRDLLAFRQNYINTTVPAQVVGTAATDRSRVLYLDKGSDDGLAIDQPVITPDGIVGRVREVYPHTAQVLEISDPTSAAGVLLEETRTRGILRGNAQGQPQIVNLMPDERIKPGQLVLTSGGDQIFPRGLPVGTVDHIAPDRENEPMVDVVLKPAANLSRLEEVLVVTGTAPAPTERTRRDVARSGLIAAGARAAEEAASQPDTQRASDVLAQRLPSRLDPADLTINPDSTPDASPATSEAAAKPLHPPSALHPDHYTPGDIPAAESLTPGQRYAPLVEGTLGTDRRAARANGDVNATETAPVSSNPAFTAANAAVAAQHKALAEAKAAEAAKRYASLHPSAASAAIPDSATAAASDTTAPAPPAYTTRVNADGTVTRVPVPTAAGATQPVHYMDRLNADGTISRIVAPAGSTAPQYTLRVNADGTTTKVPVPRPAVHFIDRLNADGTTTRIVAPPGTTAPQYILRTNADGTTTRVPVPARAATLASTTRYIDRVNADGTRTRIPAPAGTTAPQYTLRVNADGTTSRVPVPATSAASAPAAPRTAAGTSATGLATASSTLRATPTPSPRTAAGSASAATSRPATAQPRAVAPAGGVTTRVVTDGPLPSSSSTGSAARPAAPRANSSVTGAAPASGVPAAKPAAPKRRTPVIVPDDGSRPPARPAPTPAPTTAPSNPAPQGRA